jgi:outer membrane lipase/esterase
MMFLAESSDSFSGPVVHKKSNLFGVAMNFRLSGACLVLSSLTVSVTPASAQSFNQFIGFGDSNIDSGYFLTHPIGHQALYSQSAAVGGGIPTTPGGPENSTLLASYFGLTAIPVGMPGGTNYAASGAENNANNNNNSAAPSTVSQINTYLAANGGAANPNALYLINSGGNDLSYSNNRVMAGTFTAAQQKAYNQQAARDLAAGVTQLAAAGAKYIVVSDGVGGNAGPITSGRINMTNTVYANLVANGVNFIPADNLGMQQIVLHNPAMFGLTSVSNADAPGGAACVNNLGPGQTSYALYCTTLRTPNAAQTSYWADDEHLSAAGQKIEADYNYSLIVAPTEISYLAEAPVKIRAAVVDNIQNQIAISQHQRRDGTYNVWIGGDVSHLAMNSSFPGFPSDPGTPAGGSIGVDYAFGSGWLVGAAFAASTTSQSFSLGGNFRYDDYAASLYGAYRGNSIWANIVGSYGAMHYDVNRIVPIGISTQSNTGSTNGNDPSLAMELGYNFHAPLGASTPAPSMYAKAPAPAPALITHGPVVGILLQQVHVNGYTETDQFAAVGGFTALRFGDQTRNSAVTELGYQASTDVGIWHPFAKLAWNHELASTNRSVTAFVTSFAAVGIVAPGFSMPAALLGKDWASGTLGLSAAIGHGATGFATFNAQMAQGNATFYGGQLGVNVAINAPPELPVKARF